MEILQVLFIFLLEKGGRGMRPAGNTKSDEKLEENKLKSDLNFDHTLHYDLNLRGQHFLKSHISFIFKAQKFKITKT